MVKSLRQALLIPRKVLAWALSRLDAEHSIQVYRSDQVATEEGVGQEKP